MICAHKSMRTNVFVKCVIDFGMKTDATQQNVNEIEWKRWEQLMVSIGAHTKIN